LNSAACRRENQRSNKVFAANNLKAFTSIWLSEIRRHIKDVIDPKGVIIYDNTDKNHTLGYQPSGV
jgi:hypothetical protein